MKRSLFVMAAAAAILLAALAITSCKNEQSSQGLSKYVEMYSESVLSKSPILVRFSTSLPELKEGLTPEELDKAIRISPNVEFKAVKTDERSISITPQKPLANASIYKVRINLDKILSAKGPVSSIFFSVSTPGLKFIVNDEIHAIRGDDETEYQISGTVATTDYCDSAKVENGIRLGGVTQKAVWTHSEDGRTHDFDFNGIKAGASAQEITFSYDYSSMDRNAKGSDVYGIPAKGDFSAMNVEVINDPLAIEVSFSDFVSSDQQLDDCISLDPESNFKYSVLENQVRIYPDERKPGDYTLTIRKQVLSLYGKAMKEDYQCKIAIGDVKPSIKWLSKGEVLPSSNRSTILFQSTNYQKAEIRVKRIYSNNILQYMQYDTWDANYQIRNVAKAIADTTIVLGSREDIMAKGPANYGVELSKIFKSERGCIYRLEIRGIDPIATETAEGEGGDDESESNYNDYYFGDYSTFGDRSCDVLASDLGIIAKGNGSFAYTVFITNIVTGNPISGAHVRLFNYVQQQIGIGVTNADGKVEIKCPEEAFAIIANQGEDRNYLKITNEASLSTSNFDVGGIASGKSGKAFIFGDRGVWRPGDTIHVTAVCQFGKNGVPDGYPVTAELLNPDGQAVQTYSRKGIKGGMYHFPFTTSANDRTGRWKVRLTVADETFEKPLQIETVKPNRLKIDLRFNDGGISDASGVKWQLRSEWLTGLPANGLKTSATGILSSADTGFKGYDGFVFEDIDKSISRSEINLFESNLGTDGALNISGPLDLSSYKISGMLNLFATVRVFERSGDFSESSFSTKISPFKVYVGLKLNQERSEWGDDFINKTKTQTINIVALDKNGAKAHLANARLEVCRVDWSWWWNASDRDLASYMQDKSITPVVNESVSLTSGKQDFSVDLTKVQSGLYYFRISDPVGGHSAGCLAEIRTSGSESASIAGGEGSTKLNSTLDKTSYKAKETAKLSIPSSEGSRALVSIEKNGSILNTFWTRCKSGSTVIPIKITKDMLPNAYAFVTLVQPHSSTINDAPIRLYGVQCINVEDPSSHITPVIRTAESVEPEKKLEVGVSEKNGRKMEYVVEVVDEGLLGLTNFKTPDPWNYFFSKEALSIRTWDDFDHVIGAFGGKISRLFAIGGDQEMAAAVNKSQTQRFKAVSKYYGPFTLEAGRSGKVVVDVPQCLGSLRVMVIAAGDGCYGSAEKDVKVKKAVMVQATLPRIVSSGEEITLPVTIFTTEDKDITAAVNVRGGSLFEVKGPSSAKVECHGAGEHLVYFTVNPKGIGSGKITVTASGAGTSSKTEIDLQVINPNQPVTVQNSFILKAGETKKVKLAMAGMPGTNTAAVEASTIPSIDLKDRLEYLTDYPHGCVEQTVSAAFPQLYLNDVADCDAGTALRCEGNVKEALRKLAGFRNGDGSLSYWPGMSGTSEWGTAYASHFMIEAKKYGYAVDENLLRGSEKYMQRTIFRSLEPVTKAYFTYVLALGKQSQRGAMNGMKEDISKLDASTRWMLAAAYAADGQKNVAGDIIKGIPSAPATKSYWTSFGSEDRDKAVATLAYIGVRDNLNAFAQIRALATSLNNPKHFMSTQSTAWALNAVFAYASGLDSKGGVSASASVDGTSYDLISAKSSAMKKVTLKGTEKEMSVELKNNGSSECYFTVSSHGTPAAGQEKPASNGVSLSVNFSADVTSMSQGTDFTATAVVKNTSASAEYNLVLTQKFPSGWEISNNRMYDESYSCPMGVSYQDFRDDRVYSYIDYLKPGASVTIPIKLTATYEGGFYLPAAVCTGMYNDKTGASTSGKWVTVKRSNEIAAPVTDDSTASGTAR